MTRIIANNRLHNEVSETVLKVVTYATTIGDRINTDVSKKNRTMVDTMNYIVISADTKRHLAQPNVVEYVKKVSSSKYGIDTTKRPKSDTVGSFRKLAVD